MNRLSRAFHEDFGREQLPEPGSTRNFAITMAVVLVIIALVLFATGRSLALAMLASAGLVLVVEIIWPRALAPINRLWFKLGMLMGMVVSPLVMGIIFFGVVTPIALIRRLMGKDSLNLEFDPEADSYWIVRKPPGPDPKSMPRQF